MGINTSVPVSYTHLKIRRPGFQCVLHHLVLVEPLRLDGDHALAVEQEADAAGLTKVTACLLYTSRCV